MITASLRRIEEAIGRGDNERARLRDHVADLRGRVAALEAQIRELEGRLND